MMHGNMPQKHQTSRTVTGDAFESGHQLSISTQADTKAAAKLIYTNSTSFERKIVTELPLSLNVQRKIYKTKYRGFFSENIILNESAANCKNIQKQLIAHIWEVV